MYGHGLISQERDGGAGLLSRRWPGQHPRTDRRRRRGAEPLLYDAFGRTLNQTGAAANSYQFAGEQRDSALGLDYLRARYYDPATGRFVSRDAFPGSAAQPLSLNKYLYALANPVNRTDPSGNITLVELDIK